MVLRKSTVRPWPSVRCPVIQTCKRMSKIPGSVSFNFIEQDHRIWPTTHRFSQPDHPACSRRTPEGTDHGQLNASSTCYVDARLHVIVEEELRERLSQLGLPTPGSQEQ